MTWNFYGPDGALQTETTATPASTNDLSDWDNTGATVGDVATWDGTDWVPQAPAGGGATLSYLGYNTVGGSAEVMTSTRVYMRKITTPSNGILLNVQAYLNADATPNIQHYGAGVYTDNAGAPERLLTVAPPRGAGVESSVLAAAVATPFARWFSVPISLEVAAGDYWIAIANNSAAPGTIAYDATGADRYYTPGGTYFTDAGFTAVTTSANDYSIRAAFLPTA